MSTAARPAAEAVNQQQPRSEESDMSRWVVSLVWKMNCFCVQHHHSETRTSKKEANLNFPGAGPDLSPGCKRDWSMGLLSLSGATRFQPRIFAPTRQDSAIHLFDAVDTVDRYMYCNASRCSFYSIQLQLRQHEPALPKECAF